MFETRFLIHGYVYIYIYSQALILLPTSAQPQPFYFKFTLVSPPPEILDLIRNLEIAIEKAIRD